jgi:hypothetical protein
MRAQNHGQEPPVLNQQASDPEENGPLACISSFSPPSLNLNNVLNLRYVLRFPAVSVELFSASGLRVVVDIMIFLHHVLIQEMVGEL